MEDRPRTFKEVLLGRPIETSRAAEQAIGKIPALATFASDALSSVAYASEEILMVLALAGLSAFHYSIPIALAIAVLLIIVTLSYRQTIYAYPSGGGAYIVSRENLGDGPARVAGAALMTDYVLTVAVSISSGVAQIVSAFPVLQPYRVHLAVTLIVILAVINLRGTRESSAIFSVPTYFFLCMAFLTLGVGFFRWATGTLGQVSGVEMVTVTVQPLTAFLILRAFSSGSTALTGVEAISNGITAFKEPRSRNAATTLTAMSAILLPLFLGITFLANHIGALPSHSETVISQIARTVFDNRILYLLTLAATTAILFMAANTSFADFPRLGAIHASDGFLPRQLAVRGGRLVFSWGIAALAVIASLLVILFQATVNFLIPLYAVGVFLSFTMSQTGMVVHWRRVARLKRAGQSTPDSAGLEYDQHWGVKMVINALGALTTAAVTIIFAATKFRQGAWIIVLLIPALTWVFTRVKHHYTKTATMLSLAGVRKPLGSRHVETIVLIERLHAMAIRTMNFATSLGLSWSAVHVSVDAARTEELKRKWQQKMGERPLLILESPYRSLTQPLLRHLWQLREEDPTTFIHIILGELVMETYWEQALHENSALILELALRQVDGVAVTMVPFHAYLLTDEEQDSQDW
jgi:amino acid transporter